jgi:CheY-like chemotaxis protein
METIKIDAKQRTILMVDADKGLVRNFQDYLDHHEVKGKYGLNFIFVDSAKAALKKIAEMKIDLIILEIILPVINGYYLLKALNKEKNKIPVIIYTRLKGPQDLAKMAALNVDNIFIKQLMKMEDLIQIIISHEDNKVEMDKVLIELQSQIKSISDNEIDSSLRVVQCPRCSMILTRDSHFCNNCGQKIVHVAAKKLQTVKSADEEVNAESGAVPVAPAVTAAPAATEIPATPAAQ